jgi:transposase
MWTPTTRKQHIRETNRYQTDVTDKEWRVIEPHLPAAKGTGRPRAWPMREIINGIFYVMRSGCPWRLLPNDLPPWGTIYRWFATFRDESRFEKINHALVMLDRANGSDATPVRRVRSSIARASRRPRLAGPAATMRARRSTDASAMRSSTPMGAASCSNRIRRASRIAMAADRCCGLRVVSFRSSSGSSPTAGMRVTR